MTLHLQERTALLTALLLTLLAGGAHADGGVLVLDGTDGPFLITVFAAPAPLRAGPVDLSVLVRDARTGQPILDAEVRLELERVGHDTREIHDMHDVHDLHDRTAESDPHAAHATPARVVRAIATRAEATNKLLRAALIDLPAAGEWKLTVTVSRGGGVTESVPEHDTAPPAASGLGVVHTTLLAGPPLPAWISRWKVLMAPPLVVLLFLANQLLGQRRRSVRRKRGTRSARVYHW